MVALSVDIGYWDRRNSRSLHFATPDFLWNLVALPNFMRPSLRKGARVALSNDAWQEIRVRSGRDDNSFSVLYPRQWGTPFLVEGC